MKKLERIAEMPYEPRFTSRPNVQMINLDRKNVLFFAIENNNMILLIFILIKKTFRKVSIINFLLPSALVAARVLYQSR